MKIEPYLTFEGRCEEAIAFYQQALGAKVSMLMRMKDSPEPPPPGAPVVDGERILHATLDIGGNNVMLSDGMGQSPASFKGFALSISAADEASAHQHYNALAQGGEPFMPLGKTFWSPCFGMLNDRFGVCWMVGVDGE